MFDNKVEQDPWVVYHGTSNLCADQIEIDGFQPSAVSIADELKKVAAIFVAMKWSGTRQGVFEILKPFSVGYDGKRDTVFFAENSARSLLYASRDWAGGEKLRAVRKSIADLELYFREPSIRENHMEDMARKFRNLAARNAHPEALERVRPSAVDLRWLEDQLNRIRGLRELAENTLERHQYGVVYAIQLDEAEVADLSLNSSMGVESESVVSASRIIAKVHIPATYESPLLSTPQRSQHGLVYALRHS